MTYAADQLRDLLARGPYEGEDFFRLKLTGTGETNWLNVSPEQLRAIAYIMASDTGWRTVPGSTNRLVEVGRKLLDTYEHGDALLAIVDFIVMATEFPPDPPHRAERRRAVCLDLGLPPTAADRYEPTGGEQS